MFGFSIVSSRELARLHFVAGVQSAKINALAYAIDRARTTHKSQECHSMAADLQPVIDEITAANTVIDSAIAYVDSVPTLITAAVAEALAGGASAAQLQPVTDLAASLKAKSDALKDALTANTPTP